jgi:hypothetical protein
MDATGSYREVDLAHMSPDLPSPESRNRLASKHKVYRFLSA